MSSSVVGRHSCGDVTMRAPRRRARTAARASREVTLLDYGAGNVLSVRNALKRLNCTVKEVTTADDILNAKKLLFPGVGSYGQAMDMLNSRGWAQPLREYIQADRPFLGICLGLQLLFDGGTENGGIEGLGIIPGTVEEFPPELGVPVPHIGWNTLKHRFPGKMLSGISPRERFYFVHSFRATESLENSDWVLAAGEYGGEEFLAGVSKGAVHACQFHPEKSALGGQTWLTNFLDFDTLSNVDSELDSAAEQQVEGHTTGFTPGLASRVIACLDVRANDEGDLVVTKGDQYDVRESTGTDAPVRNLGKPVSLAERYYKEGADEITFLNITGFRDLPLEDLPMLQVLRQASAAVAVPLTVGGGIRDFTDGAGVQRSALEVAGEYFRSGADKVSIGSDAVEAALKFRRSGVRTGQTSIETISTHYGKQAVVVSIDPKRVWEADAGACPHTVVRSSKRGPNGEEFCWWQCTVKGGRETRDLGAVELACAVEALGAGEILLNCIDCDGVGQGFDLELVDAVSSAVSIPVIASSGAGSPGHFTECFRKTKASAALAAGIFHRQEVAISTVKQDMVSNGLPVRV